MIKLEKFEGHIVLYCKGYYRNKNVSFIEGLQRIWAVRCGHDLEYIDNSSKEYIANKLYSIISKISPKKIGFLNELIHKELSKTYLSQYEGLSSIEKLIMIYKSQIMMVQIKEKVNKNYKWLVKLPKPQKRLFNRIVKGTWDFNDYKKIV